MTLIRNEDEATGDIGCASKTCDYPAVQTIKMACVPWSREGEKIKGSNVRYEYVGICEGHWKVHFKIRAQHIPIRFIAGRN
jgi:hypothetical protein